MPYIVCPSCGLRVYAAAAYLGVDSCSRCGSRLRGKPSGDRAGLHLRYASEAIEVLPGPSGGTTRSRKV
jgi:DNA-directed RNA polymerase subunit RPC12/RpoP